MFLSNPLSMAELGFTAQFLTPRPTSQSQRFQLHNPCHGVYQTERVGPTSQSCKISSTKPAKTSKGKIFLLGPWEVSGTSARDSQFIARSSSVLDVDKAVEREGGGGGNYYDAIVIGSGIGGLVAATQLAVKGARVLALEKYVIPGGSSGFYERNGYTFDVGSSVMFGFSDKVSLYVYGVKF